MLARVSEEARKTLSASVPNPARLGLPDEFAQLAMHIVSNQMINGETIRLDGALRMAPR
jgi:NAD(P)-dependent dehydrogenase (short-subunit alcohol dehydrogenase family)